jgi:ABC-type polar amino acid transport system ATPase subunit
MDKGKVIERNASGNFFDNPQSDRAKEFIDRVLQKI